MFCNSIGMADQNDDNEAQNNIPRNPPPNNLVRPQNGFTSQPKKNPNHPLNGAQMMPYMKTFGIVGGWSLISLHMEI